MPTFRDYRNSVHPAEDREAPGVLYDSHTASRGQVVWYSVLDRAALDKITVSVPAEYADGELYDAIERAVRETIARHAAEHPEPAAPRPDLRLVG